MKSSLAFIALILFTTSAQAGVFFEGQWKTTTGKAVLYHDQTVSYQNCKVGFRMSNVNKPLNSHLVKIEKLAAQCEHPTYWSFSQVMATAEFVVDAAGVVKTASGNTVGTLTDDAFSVKFEDGGQVFFIDVTQTSTGIQLDWSSRSFDDVNFDLTAEMTSSKI